MALNLLASYAYAQRWDMAELRGALRCGRLLVDSGAFTAYKTGRRITVGEYASWLEQWRGAWDYAITLDVIGDPATSRRQTRKLHARGLPVVPVFTVGDTIDEFRAMVRDSGYVAVGGLVGIKANSAKIARLRLLQRRAEELGGGIHALGIGSMPTLRAARCYTADASTAASVAQYGMVAFYDGRLIRQVMPSNDKDRPTLVAYRDALIGHGLDVAALLRERRVPTGEGRPMVLRAQMLAYSLADEDLLRHDVPPPRGATGPGTRLFVAIDDEGRAHRVAAWDASFHDGPAAAPRSWQRVARRHVCERAPVPAGGV